MSAVGLDEFRAEKEEFRKLSGMPEDALTIELATTTGWQKGALWYLRFPPKGISPYRLHLPRFAGDLNKMAILEAMLADGLRDTYVELICNHTHGIFATACDRAACMIMAYRRNR